MSFVTRMARLSAAGTFAAFRHRNYRLWFIGQLMSLVGTWMQNVAQGYLLYTLTGSAAYLGYVGFASGLPSWALMVYGGLLADRIPRRTLLLVTQSAKMMLAFVLAGLAFFDRVQPWHILALASLLGVANALETPARKSLVVDLVTREDLTNAITLGDAMYNISVIIGPTAGAVVYSLAGPAACFFLNGVSFVAVIAALLRMRIPSVRVLAPRGPVWAAVAAGIRYVRGDRIVRTLITGEFLISLIGFGPMVLLPAWAVRVMNGDVTTNGLLLAVHSIGAVVAGLLIAAVASRRNRGRVWTLGSLTLGPAMAAFALSRNLPISSVCLCLAGFAYVTLETNNSAVVQSLVPDELRGRVTALYTLMYTGGEPLGSLAMGLLAERTSEPFTFLACSAGLMLYAVLIWLRRPEVRAVE